MAIFCATTFSAEPSAGTPLEARTEAPDNAFTRDLSPRILVRLADRGPVPRFIRVEHFDWLTEQTATDWIDVPIGTAAGSELAYAPEGLPYGLHRFTFTPAAARSATPGESTDDAEKGINVAYAPARRAAELPDDWPMGAMYFASSGPILPGYKWYRIFYHWAKTQPKPGEWNWGELDRTFAEVKAYGGKLMLVSDGAPDWTTTKPDKNRGIAGSQYFPDDPEDLRRYIRAVLERYDDGSGTLGAIEMWNEPNANFRWADTPEKLIELYSIYAEETAGVRDRIKLIGLTSSPGHHLDYYEELFDLGALDHMDIVGGHFYEETGSLQRETPINNLPQHVALLLNPQLRRGVFKPIWNTETEAHAGARADGRFLTQAEINARAEASEKFDPATPWLLDGRWRKPSERRIAAQSVSALVTQLANNVTMNITFHPKWYRKDGTLILQWVAHMAFGDLLTEVDYHTVMPFSIDRVGGDERTAAVAYRIGKWDGPNVVVAWAFQNGTRHGRPDRWTDWQDPVPLTFRTQSESVEVEDMYRRTRRTIPVVDGVVTIEAGEEPVYIHGLTPPANP